jgi:colanic acid/amylovoran biosynthesis glycosyltransferase
MLPAFDLRIPVVVSCRGSQMKVAPHDPSRTGIVDGLAVTFRKATFVHCVSQDILNDALQLGLDPARAELIRPAVDTSFFAQAEAGDPAGQTGPAFRVITTGGLNWKKGHEFALSALADLSRRGVPVRFEIVGDGPDRARILYTINDLGLNGAVELTGRLDPERVRDRLRAADVFLLSSVSEGISNSVLEAMACGLPVVTTDCGGMREAVSDGVEGFVVPVRAPAAMADALQALAVDGDLRRRMGRAGRARVVREFELSAQVEQFDRLCHRAARATGDERGSGHGGE